MAVSTTIEEVGAPRPSAADPESAIWNEQRRRQKILEEACPRLNMSLAPTVGYRHMLVNDQYKILFNFIPKVSCTSWKAIWRQLPKHSGSGKWYLGQYSAAERDARLASYRKVLFVREPLSRVLSAYMSKFQGGVLYDHASLQRVWERTFGRDIVRRYRGVQVSTLEKGQWLNITLPEFLKYITDLGSGIPMTLRNDHWLPQHIVSHPCQTKYDFIGHFENLATEGPYVLQWLGIDHLVEFPEYHNSNAVHHFVDYYKQIPLELIHSLTEYYQEDYRIFGYSPEDTISRVTRGIFHDDSWQ